MEIAPVEEYETFYASVSPSKASTNNLISFIHTYNVLQQFVGFVDPSADASNPGWPLRNLLAYLRALYPTKTTTLQILRWKDGEPSGFSDGSWKSQIGTIKIPPTDASATLDPTVKPTAVGWEKNPQGKLGPRVADLAPMMDPTR